MEYSLTWELVPFPEKSAEDFDVVAWVSDDNASYSFDDLTVIREKATKNYFVVQASGCSCPSHEERAELTFGPGSLTQVIDWVKMGDYSGNTYSGDQERGLIEQLEATKVKRKPKIVVEKDFVFVERPIEFE